MDFKQEGFNNQRAIVLPHQVIIDIKVNPVTKFLFVTDIGYYPKANHHKRTRGKGSEQYILIYCVNGRGWIETADGKLEIGADVFFIIPAHIPHSYGANHDDPWTIYWIHFSGLAVPKLFTTDLIYRKLNNTKEDYLSRIAIFEEIYYNLSMGFGNENLEYASTCLWHLLGTFKYGTPRQQKAASGDSDLIEKTISYMHEHLHEKIILETLAKSAGRSVSHFSLLFKKVTSKSPIEYFNYLKIQRSCQLLDFTSFSIKEIAEKLAFEDPFYFSRLFKKTMGMSPAKYRGMEKG